MYEDLIKYLRVCANEEDGSICRDCPFNDCEDMSCFDGLMEAAADAIETLTAITTWVSVEDRLPRLKCGDEGYTGYLVYSNGYVQVADYTGDKLCDTPWFHVDGEYETGVTHWMPLPELPQNNETELLS